VWRGWAGRSVQAGLFAAPTYAFIGSVMVLLLVGQKEAEQVRAIFELFAQNGSLSATVVRSTESTNPDVREKASHRGRLL
jgi:hypothetical protein